MPETTPPLFLPVSGTYGGRDLALPYRDVVGEGVRDHTDMLVTQRGAGANMSVDVSTGVCWIMGDASATAQGNHRCTNIGPTNVAVTAAHATLPRIDSIVAEVLDHGLDGSGQVLWRLRNIAGTATGGAALDNRTGAAALPSSAILLADVLVAAADTSITNAEIRDRRPFALPGTIPPLTTDVDIVGFEPGPGLFAAPSEPISHASHDLQQNYALCYLPRRIVGATRIRWRYLHGGTALTGNYRLTIADASGRVIADAGSVAFTGGANTSQIRAETIAAQTFEAGNYYVGLGVDTTAGAATIRGIPVRNAAGTSETPPFPNIAYQFSSGGVANAAPLNGAADIGVGTTINSWMAVPLVALSVG